MEQFLVKMRFQKKIEESRQLNIVNYEQKMVQNSEKNDVMKTINLWNFDGRKNISKNQTFINFV